MSENRDWAGAIIDRVRLCIASGAGWKQAEQFLRRRVSLADMRAELEQTGHTVPAEDAEPDDKAPCEQCPYKPEPADAPAATGAAKATSWDALIAKQNAAFAAAKG